MLTFSLCSIAVLEGRGVEGGDTYYGHFLAFLLVKILSWRGLEARDALIPETHLCQPPNAHIFHSIYTVLEGRRGDHIMVTLGILVG